MSGSGADIAAVADQHTLAEFVQRDVDATMETMADSPYLALLPVMSGGVGFQEVRGFYERFIAQLPDDVEMTPVSRTVGEDQLVDELVLSFTHTREWDAMLPGVPPSGRSVRLACCVVMRFEDGRLAHEHLYWDQASLLAQVGLLDPAGLPIVGHQQADKLLNPRGHR
jgi:carboxymethylenebutenolidase